MKGISAIIATILLLLIVVAIVGFTFNFFQSMFTTTTSSTDKMVNQTTNSVSQVIKISNAGLANAVVANLGTVNIPISQLGVYINSQYAACNWTDTTGTVITQIVPNAYGKCVYNTTNCTAGATLKVTTPSTYDTATC